MRRISEGFLLVRNPVRYHQVSRVSLDPSVVDGFVFWTKNPEPMMPCLSSFPYPFYFHYTLNGYGPDMEINLPSLEKRIETFKRLSSLVGKERVIWRYDPIILDHTYSVRFHEEMFSFLASSLSGFTDQVTISFVDPYAHVKGIEAVSIAEQQELAGMVASVSSRCGMRAVSCAETESFPGISHGCCVDPSRLGISSPVPKDRSQRGSCLCASSVDIGCYDTCGNGCRYCYATRRGAKARLYDVSSPLLCSAVEEEDTIVERRMVSYRSS